MRISSRTSAAYRAPSAADVIRWLLIASLAWAATAAHARDLPAAADSRWIEARTESFLITSQRSEPSTRRLAEHAEALRAAIDQLTQFDVTVSRPIFVTVFSDRLAMRPYLHRIDGQPVSASGTSTSSAEADFILVDGGAPNPRAVLAHQYAHLFLGRSHPRLPLWLKEGLVEFFQTFEVIRGTARIGGPIESHVRRLRSKPWLSMDRLIALDHSDWLYNEGDRKTMVYAQVWALTHHLLIGAPERAGQLSRFVRMVDDGAQHDEAFVEAFGTDPDSLVAEVRAAIRRPVLGVFEAPVLLTGNPNITVSRISEADHLTRLGEVWLSEPSRPASVAERHFEAALARDADWAKAHSGLGEVALRQRRPDGALQHQRKAAGLDPNDPVIAYRLGKNLGLVDPGSDAAVAALVRATTLDPNFAPAWAALVNQYRAAGDHAQAVEAAGCAATLEPLNAELALEFLDSLMRSSRRTEALKLLESAALRGADDQTKAWASIARADLEAIRLAIDDGRIDDAEMMMTSFESDVLPRIGDEHAGIRLDTLRNQASDRRFSQRLAAAADARLAGDHEEAEMIAREVADDVSAGLWADRARRFLAGSKTPPSDPTLVASVSPGDMQRLNGLLATGNYRGALRLLEDLDQRVSHDRDDWIDAKIREIERALARNVFVDTYNRAVDLYNAGSIEAACQVMRGVDPLSLGSADRQDVLDFLADCP
jgi:tetratricopeptide (TPR) repeat protein